MQTSSVTLGTLIDRALYELEAPAERGAPLVMGSDFLENTTDTQFTLSTGELSVSDIAEFGSELVLVTAKSADVDPIYTVSRGYYGTAKAVQAAGDLGSKNPQFARRRVADAVDRALPRLEALGVPMITSATMSRTADLRQLELPATCRQVLQVLYVNATSGRVLELEGWFQYDTVPTGVSSTGKLLMLPWYVKNSDSLHLVYSTPYVWATASFPDETATLTLPIGAEELPSTYAAAMMVAGREVSRQELDRSEEFSRTSNLQQNSGGALVRATWQNFYRTLDEVRRVVTFEVPTARPLRTRPKVRI